ncbi:IS4 family transposase [Streptomyces sp. NBC_00878]|uniref:IS4 family transposase n=1 Tax=Streptomyces sp. NBC_00878 TaxID=2975854 RepID=UPI00224FE196|nr:IS4 family transposase [Streptomyces sp. NBC_00878]MCX4910364.1 IS4 family transposase [Streptomyces sp. NBC_00878]
MADGGFSERFRLDVLSRVFPADLVDFVVDETGVREERIRSLPSWLVVYFTLAMWLFTGSGYDSVLRELVENLPRCADGWLTANSGSITRARARIGAAPLRLLFSYVAGPVGTAATPGVFWRGRRLASMDGTTLDVPNSAANAAAYSRPNSGSGPRPYPQVRLLALVECGTRALIGAAFDSPAVGEGTLTCRLLHHLEAGMLVLADRDFPSYALWRRTVGTGADLLFRVDTSFALPMARVLPDGTYHSELRGSRKTERVTVRVIEYTITTSGAEDGQSANSELFRLVTTLLDPQTAPAHELAELYSRRWTSKTIYRAIKIEQRGGRTATLRSNSPETVAQELWSMLCVYQAVRHLIPHTATETGAAPERVILKHAVDALRRTAGSGSPSSPPGREDR